MKKLLLSFILLSITFPVVAEESFSKIREKRPFSLGINLGLNPFFGFFADYALDREKSVGLNLSTNIISNSLLLHYRHYFVNPESEKSDFYTESRAGLAHFNPLWYGKEKFGGNLAQYVGYEYRSSWGLIFNGNLGASLFVNTDLSGMVGLSGELGLGYAF